ncbi:MerR family transcriptional regulator [Curtobacterium oceanosedimentum]|uniref:MerR family transcriptional regulator n=2 Tax=Curtobacterium oceanosedimentum TaxID=465820 RepID=A0A147DUY4_9MICO|nr:MerR family transcriptional regulator [Curtobacterium oceanosedimentum]KTR54054.1 MerR family transcriptional regulator [Curtobacterium oceanosedimentum]
MQIGEVAERTGLSVKTIRDYDAAEVLHPSGRTDGGFRLYSEDDVARLLMVRRMKPLGFSLGEAGILVDAVKMLDEARPDVDLTAVRSRVAAFIRDAETRRDVLGQQLGMVDEFLEELRAH